MTCAGKGLCDKLIIRPKESCHMSNKIKKAQKGGQDPTRAVEATDDYSFQSTMRNLTSQGGEDGNVLGFDAVQTRG
jgi:hypothetical protein